MKEVFKKIVYGDKDAFEEIVQAYQKQLLVIANSKLKDRSLAWDAVQETFITLYLNINKIKNYDKLKSWLAVVLMNNCNKINKKKEFIELSYDEAECEKKLATDNEEFDKIFDEMDFFNCISFLNEEERTIMAMYYSNEYTVKEISDILNINLGTVKSKISRAKIKIRMSLGGKNNEYRE